MPATRWREVLLTGPDGWTQGYVEGFLRAREVASPAIDAEREGFDCSSMRERLGELLDPSEATLHLLVREDVLPVLEQAVRDAPGGRSLALRGTRPVAGVRLPFSFRIHSREHARRIRGDFESPPPGARLAPDSRLEEIVRPADRGPDMLAPEHAFTLDGDGAVEGDPDAVLALRDRYRDEELVRLGTPHLVPAR